MSNRILKFLSLAVGVFFMVVASLLFFTSKPAQALDTIKIQFGGVSLPIEVQELVTFARTGEQSQQIRSMFLTASASPEQIERTREILNYSAKVESTFVDEILSSRYGRLAISEFSNYFGPNTKADQIKDQVIASMKSVTMDGQLGIIEIIENFQWTDEIVINGDGIVKLAKETINFGRNAIEFVKDQPIVQKIVCGR